MPCSNTAPPMMSRVEGLLFESDAWPGWWAQLDDFAGPDYGRVLARVRRRASIGSASCAPRNRLGITDVDHRPGAVARRLVRPRRGVNRATSVVRITTRPSPTPGRRTGRGT